MSKGKVSEFAKDRCAVDYRCGAQYPFVYPSVRGFDPIRRCSEGVKCEVEKMMSGLAALDDCRSLEFAQQLERARRMFDAGDEKGAKVIFQDLSQRNFSGRYSAAFHYGVAEMFENMIGGLCEMFRSVQAVMFSSLEAERYAMLAELEAYFGADGFLKLMTDSLEECEDKFLLQQLRSLALTLDENLNRNNGGQHGQVFLQRGGQGEGSIAEKLGLNDLIIGLRFLQGKIVLEN